MSREAHVQFCERLGVELPGATHRVIHCKSEVQARLVLRKLGVRLGECGLELHPEKTRIVYCQDVNRQAAHPTIHFTFLGYTFRPRKAVDKYGRVYVNFSPGVSREALKKMRQTVRGWHIQLMCDQELNDLSNMFGPILRGWANYYGRFYPTALKPLWRQVNDYLCAGCGGNTRPWRAASRVLPGHWAALLKPHRVHLCIGSGDFSPRLGDGSRMSREVHVRFCEGLGLQYPGLLTRSDWKGRAFVSGRTKSSRPAWVRQTDTMGTESQPVPILARAPRLVAQ